MTGTRILALSLIGGALIAAGGVASYLAVPRKSHDGHTPSELLKRYGYLEIRPAMHLNGPGTIVTVEQINDEFVMLHPTCKMDAAELATLWQTSESVDTDVASELRGEFELAAKFLERMGLNVGGHAIKEANIRYDNTRVIQLADEVRFGLGDKYLKDECLRAVAKITSDEKHCVTQPVSAMQADVSYRLKFSRDVSAGEKAQILKTKVFGEAAGRVESEERSDSSDIIVGKGLFVGLKLNAPCIVPNDGKHDSDADARSVQSLPMSKSGAHYVKR